MIVILVIGIVVDQVFARITNGVRAPPRARRPAQL